MLARAELNNKKDELILVAYELAQYASYAERTGHILQNRTPIRKNFDEFLTLIKQI